MPTDNSIPVPAADPPIIIPCETGGGFQIGFGDDAPGPFASREFAAAVAASADRRASAENIFPASDPVAPKGQNAKPQKRRRKRRPNGKTALSI